jgi:sarcosine oxidase subunit delta
MSFLLACPNCGPRDVYEFRFGGEAQKRPAPEASRESWIEYLYFRDNGAGLQTEWWYHRMGCRTWFLAVRDTRTNEVREVRRPEEKPVE